MTPPRPLGGGYSRGPHRATVLGDLGMYDVAVHACVSTLQGLVAAGVEVALTPPPPHLRQQGGS